MRGLVKNMVRASTVRGSMRQRYHCFMGPNAARTQLFPSSPRVEHVCLRVCFPSAFEIRITWKVCLFAGLQTNASRKSNEAVVGFLPHLYRPRLIDRSMV